MGFTHNNCNCKEEDKMERVQFVKLVVTGNKLRILYLTTPCLEDVNYIMRYIDKGASAKAELVRGGMPLMVNVKKIEPDKLLADDGTIYQF